MLDTPLLSCTLETTGIVSLRACGRKFMKLRLIPFCYLLSSLAICLFVSVRSNAKPNILVIVGDDMGYADIGVHGCRDIPTPNIDSLAARGVRCTNGYVSCPYCSPTRAGMLTGRYQTRFGHEFNPGDGRFGGGAAEKGKQIGLPLTETTIADRLKADGYETGWVGKWHLGSSPQFIPHQRGFDATFGFLGGSHGYFPDAKPPMLRDNKPIVEKEYLTDAFGREAVDFIEHHAGKPFFLYLAFNAVHTPMNATDARLDKFKSIKDTKRRTYAAMMSAMDENIGRVLRALRENKLEENTLVFFISDNGGPTMPGTSINASRNDPLRGSKRTTLEGGIRVPYLVKWPGHVPAGSMFHKPVIQLDILPTALAAAGVKLPSDAKVDGVNLLPYLNSKSDDSPHSTLYWRFGEQMAIRQGDWKLVRYDPVMDGLKGNATGPKLYNLAMDIGERTDVIKSEPEKARSLQAAWDEWNQSNVPPLWGGGKAKQKKAAGKRTTASIQRAAKAIEAAE
jgi:arylsulfatase A-like enzyme